MIDQATIDYNKEIIIGLLCETSYRTIDSLIDWLEETGYFTSPGSTKYHACYKGGLAAHSLAVYSVFSATIHNMPLDIPETTRIVAGLLHDVCKVGAYTGTEAPYDYNKDHPKGHGRLSVEIIERYIPLSDLEREMILYHMGMYGTFEFSKSRGEYTLKELTDAFDKSAVKLFYLSDERATAYEKAQEAAANER